MDLSNILAINGKPGLFRLVSKSKTNFIVESLLDNKKMPAFSHDGVSSLDNIAIFTEEEDIALEKVFQSIFQKENSAKIDISSWDNNRFKAYFEEVLPDYDKERVYVSNIKKVLSWYNILVTSNLIDLNTEEENEKEVITEPEEEKTKEE